MQFNFGVAQKTLFAKYWTNRRVFSNAYFSGPAVNINGAGGSAGVLVTCHPVTTVSTAGNVTLTVDQFMSGLWDRDIAATPRTDTTPTAAALIAEFGSGGGRVGDAFPLLVLNRGSAVLTIAGGTGVTLLGLGTIPANTNATFRAIIATPTTITLARF